MTNNLLSTEMSELTSPEVLLVDDSAVQAGTRQAILSRAGFRVVLASGSMAALEMVMKPEINRSLRLIVTDHLMPEMNGPELVRKVRAALPNIPVLVLSGMPGAESEYEGLNVSFQLKPFPPEDLIRTAHTLMSDFILRSA